MQSGLMMNILFDIILQFVDTVTLIAVGVYNDRYNAIEHDPYIDKNLDFEKR